tara:strand:- start:647 stop:1729 length:1083 start_codon:yes stop_codon:yes gene_type:complete
MQPILSNETESPEKYEGTVSWFNKEKGFGLIIYSRTETDLVEYFVHHSSITTQHSTRSFLNEGEKVCFTPKNDTSKNRLKAEEVTATNGNTLACDKEQPRTRFQKSDKQVKNTTCFTPQTKPCDMRILYGWMGFESLYYKTLTTHDIILLEPFCHNGLFHTSRQLGGESLGLPDRVAPDTWFNFIKEELDEIANKYCEGNQQEFLKLWHGDNHLIADDKLADSKTQGNWKEKCPRLNNLINSIATMFGMKTTSTRVNLYRNGNDWKPYHHDAAALKDNIKKVQNITVSVNIGSTREIAFENSETNTTLSIPLMDGYIYSFGQDVNVNWKHGVLKGDPVLGPRYSIVLWGWVDQVAPQIFK